jgi:hypothetical protein
MITRTSPFAKKKEPLHSHVVMGVKKTAMEATTIMAALSQGLLASASISNIVSVPTVGGSQGSTMTTRSRRVSPYFLVYFQ